MTVYCLKMKCVYVYVLSVAGFLFKRITICQL